MVDERGHRAPAHGGLLVALLASLAVAASASAASKPITGKLSKPGYEVMALAATGEASSAVAGPRFTVRPTEKMVSLHLRGPDGTYTGPVVAAKERGGRRAVVGVRAGAKLGDVAVKAAKGYARLAEAPPERALDRDRVARAVGGVPIGAGNFGRVRSRPSGDSADQDLDALPDSLDVDDDGDLVLDNLDTTDTGRRALRTPADPCGPGRIYCQVTSASLGLTVEQTVNANLGSSTEQIDAALAAFGGLRIAIGAYPTGPIAAAELDCGDPNTGLKYCRQNNSTGTIFGGTASGSTFPSCCDTDGDGFGTLGPSGGGPNDFFLTHGAQARVLGLDDPNLSQIGSGDPVYQWVTSGGDPAECPPLSATCVQRPALVQYVIATVPTLVSYDDRAGNSPTVSYPAPTIQEPPPGIAPGSAGNGFPVADSAGDADSDVEVTLTFSRPQRSPIPDERCPEPVGPVCDPQQWIDIGGLTYNAAVRGVGSADPSPGGPCPQSSYTEFDPQKLSPPTIPPVINYVGGLTDGALDQPANPTNTVTYTLNLSQCLASLGRSFDVGEEQMIEFTGQHGGDAAAQLVAFERRG